MPIIRFGMALSPRKFILPFWMEVRQEFVVTMLLKEWFAISCC
jgi:hypothetical protein